ncbi:MAG: iron export ABC transporter permease subunit FetB [Hyphomicrobiales bacterium]|nr:MAG: iron export ABC transporter permease subunit FetB [Hyphomicrobiales bacterium]
MNAIPLTYWDLATASLLLAANGVLSAILGLGIAGRLAIAALRMLVQLLLIGLVLTWLFAQQSPLWTGLAALVMIGFAGYEISARQDYALKGWWNYGLGAMSITIASTLVVMLALTTHIRPTPWYHAQYALPILGMILGNVMTGVSLGLNTLTTTARRERAAIEARLMLGASRGKALSGTVRQALRSGLIPLINAMSVMGLVSLPGMMTGQILAGAPPIEAVKYQLLIMFLIGGATGSGVILAVYGAAHRLTDARHRLRLDRLGANSGH